MEIARLAFSQSFRWVMQQTEVAEALFTTIETSLSSSARTAIEHAWLPYHRHEWPEAQRRFAAVRVQFPDEPAGYLGGAAVLTNQGLIRDAEAILEDGMTRLENEPLIRLDYARLPVADFLRDKRNWAEAIRRLDQLNRQFPEFEVGLLTASHIRRDAGHVEEAEALVADAKHRLPNSSRLAIEHARIALARSDWNEAVTRFVSVMECFPDTAEGYVGLAEALTRQEKFHEAEEILQTAMLQFPNEIALYREYAQIANRQNDLEVALERWMEAKKRFPHDAQVSQHVFEAQLRLTEITNSERVNPSDREYTDAVDGTQHHFILDFESLGGTLLGCEFGLVQRALGVEPLGLLRWSDMSPANIIKALEARFDGVGEPENTELLVPEKDGRAEYASRDRRFGMRMHTFVARDDAAPDLFLKQLCRRLRYLKNKLIEDLTTNAKVFVYKITATNLSSTELSRLHIALRQYGANTLLYIRYADCEYPAGSVIVHKPGLLIGYIDHFAMGRNEENLGPATIAWTEICEKAHRIWKSGASEVGDALSPCSAEGDQPYQNAQTSPGDNDHKNGHEDDSKASYTEMDWLHDQARAMEKLENWAAAEKYRRKFIALDHSIWWGYASLASVLRQQGRIDEAAAVLADGVTHLPNDPRMAAEIARDAERAKNWGEAIRLWDDIIAKFPDKWIGFRGKANTLAQSGQTTMADGLVYMNASFFPEDADAIHDIARVAERAHDWKRAEIAWRTFLAKKRQPSWAYHSLAIVLCKQGLYTEAEAVLDDAVEFFPNDVDLFVEAAQCADLRGDVILSARYWQAVSSMTPTSPKGPLGEASMLRKYGQIEVADEVTQAAIRRLPDEPSLLDCYVLNAMAHLDWTDALTRLEVAQRRFPSYDAFRQRNLEVRLRITDNGGILPAAPAEDEGVAEDRALVMQFESLGGTGHGCEFGICQRHFGAEPLGLLRWADLGPDNLSQMLETDFAGVGEPEFTNVFIPNKGTDAEYWTTDKRYHMAMRTFVRVVDTPLDHMRQQVTKRYKFLTRKLIDDLRIGTKILVYKNMKRNLTDRELRRLHTACRRYGNNTLFYISYQDQDHTSGTVKWVGEGLIIGYIDRFSHHPDTDAYLGSVENEILALCKAAHLLWQNQVAADVEPT